MCLQRRQAESLFGSLDKFSVMSNNIHVGLKNLLNTFLLSLVSPLSFPTATKCKCASNTTELQFYLVLHPTATAENDLVSQNK